MCFPVPYAGFFATHNNLFFYISFLYVYLPPLKNDGTSELRSGVGLNTCLSFLNEVMASEPFFKEQSDAVKMSETPYPTNGSGKNLGIGCKS